MYLSKSILACRTADLTYSPKQEKALLDISCYLRNRTPGQPWHFTLKGYAGTGKTTIMENVVNFASSQLQTTVVVAAPTNKALSVLREKITAPVTFTTLHRLYYGSPIEGKWISQNRYLSPNTLLIVDESSMITKPVYTEIEKSASFGGRVLFVGDSFQLPPVDPSGAAFSVLDQGNAELTEIKRQDEGSDILALATTIRKLNRVVVPDKSSDNVYVTRYDATENFSKVAKYKKDAVYLVSRNDRRNIVNGIVRATIHGSDTVAPKDDDLCVSVSNSSTFANGEVFRLQKSDVIAECIPYYLLRDESGYTLFHPNLPGASLYHTGLASETLEWLRTEAPPTIWKSGKKYRLSSDANIATYGYSLTAHKAQGSQWDIAYIDVNADPRWMYTAITRAVKTVVLAMAPPTIERKSWDEIRSIAYGG